MTADQPAFGGMLRHWRQRRRFSQLGLAAEAELSQRHLSFLETGRSRPSRETVALLSDTLALPLEERNALFLSAGFAAPHARRPLSSPDLREARGAIRRIIEGQMPYPAVVVDRHWTLLEANDAAHELLEGVAPRLLAGEINVLRASLHPDSLAPRIANLAEWRAHLLARLRHEVRTSGDGRLRALLDELVALPGPRIRPPDHAQAALAVPLRLRTGSGLLSFLSTTTVFGTATDLTLATLTIESFFPADERTRMMLNEAPEAAGRDPGPRQGAAPAMPEDGFKSEMEREH